jgi:hypothetical protein
MSDIKLFRIGAGGTAELAGYAAQMEKSLQHLFEANLETLLGIRFLAAEYSTGAVHGGRIDTLGLDEDDCPVIIVTAQVAGRVKPPADPRSSARAHRSEP